MTYTDLPADELLTALQNAGRTPDIELIRAAQARCEELTPQFLEWFGEDVRDKDWGQDDPRWYKQIHAGNFLLSWHEPAALPIFEKMLRSDSVYDDTPLEWFDTHIQEYGTSAIPMLLRVLADKTLTDTARSTVGESLMQIAAKHPEQREQIIAGLRSVLPVLDDNGKLKISAKNRAEPPNLWTWTAWNLAQLHDEASRPQIEALHKERLIDKMMAGDLKEYTEALESDKLPWDADREEFDIIKLYENLHDQAIKEAEFQRKAEERRISEETRRLKELERLEAMPPQKPAQASREGVYAKTKTFVRETPKVGRNDPCPCGSGKKYKHCHGK